MHYRTLVNLVKAHCRWAIGQHRGVFWPEDRGFDSSYSWSIPDWATFHWLLVPLWNFPYLPCNKRLWYFTLTTFPFLVNQMRIGTSGACGWILDCLPSFPEHDDPSVRLVLSKSSEYVSIRSFSRQILGPNLPRQQQEKNNGNNSFARWMYLLLHWRNSLEYTQLTPRHGLIFENNASQGGLKTWTDATGWSNLGGRVSKQFALIPWCIKRGINLEFINQSREILPVFRNCSEHNGHFASSPIWQVYRLLCSEIFTIKRDVT